MSHGFSFEAPVKSVFKISLIAERLARAQGFHYVIMVDTSGSMAGEKMALAKKGAEEFVKKIPSDNYLSFLTFSDSVKVLKEYSESMSLSDCLPMMTVGGETKLYSALLTAFELANKHEIPGWIVLLTDGEPTDVIQPEAYKALRIPKGFEMIEFGIGDTYNEGMLKALADSSGGKLFHMADPTQVPISLGQSAVSEVAAKNVIVELNSVGAVKLLNFPGPPANLNAVVNATKIWGDVLIPANFSGQILDVHVTYDEPSDGNKKELNIPVSIVTTNQKEKFMASINKAVIAEYNYYQTLEKYYADLASGSVKQAEKTMKLLASNAEQTRRLDLIQSTKKLSSSLEQTKKLGATTEATKKLSKEAASEATKRARSSGENN
jgi:Ca-activated chloride channel family protein